jgi:hypothetical protein
MPISIPSGRTLPLQSKAGGGFRSLGVGGGGASNIIFQDNFDAQPDWTNEMYSVEVQQDLDRGDIMPVDWFSSYASPGFGRPAIEILASNSDKTRSGTGKSFVSWKEHNSTRANQFTSNSTLTKRIAGPDGIGVDQLYAEFWLRFDPNWTPEFNLSKFFRVFSNRLPGGNIQSFGEGKDSGPVLFFDYEHSKTFGAFNRLAFRSGPWGEVDTYKPPLSGTWDWPASVPDGNQNFLGYQLLQQIPDKLNGGLIPLNNNGNGVTHAQAWGPLAAGLWTKLGFFVKMNSANDVEDGVFMQWRDDKLILKTEDVAWMRSNAEGLTPAEVKWNAIAIGGNDNVQGDSFPHPIWPNAAEHEEWYAIDDFLVTHDIPAGLETTV